MTCNMRSTQEAIIGDTFHKKDQPVEPLMEVEKPKPMVYAGFYPMDPKEQVRAIQPQVVSKLVFFIKLVHFSISFCFACSWDKSSIFKKVFKSWIPWLSIVYYSFR